MATQPPHAVTSVLKTVGRTPLVRLEPLEFPGGPKLWAKCEFLGPGNSIFDRAAVAEIVAGDRAGHLLEGKPIVAAGGTDASISLAMAASANGNPLTILVPRSMLPERRRALLDYGAKLENLDDSVGFEQAQELAFDRAGKEHAAYANLFEGDVVVRSYGDIAAEVVEALGNKPDLTLCGLDLGAIPTGIARGLSGAPLVAVEPANARIGSGGGFAPHLMLGLAPAPQATALDRSLVKDFEPVDDREAWDMSERLTKSTGLLAGLASGAVLVAALRRMKSLPPSANVVAVLPDSGERRFMLASFFQ